MRFRRRKDADEVEDDVRDPSGDEADGTDAEDLGDADGTESDTEADVDDDDEAEVDARADGPWDVDEQPPDPEEPAQIDLGGLIVRGRPGFDLQIPSDEGTERLAAVLLVAEEAAVEIRAFAAPRTGGLWDEVRGEILAEVERLEGRVEEVRGRHGRELRIQVPARTPDGRDAVQPSRIVGVEGPRWFLRGTFMGRAALEPDDDGVLERGFREVVVRRGGDPKPPREPLEVVLPESAVPADGAAGAAAGADGEESGDTGSTRET